jgi:hypothetical protein
MLVVPAMRLLDHVDLIRKSVGTCLRRARPRLQYIVKSYVLKAA